MTSDHIISVDNMRSNLNNRSRLTLLSGAVFSAIAVFLLFYVAARHNQFVSFDDYAYIVENQQLKLFDRGSIIAEFTTFIAGNWHPLTMLSLKLDLHLWGADPAGFHLTSALIHSATVFVLCLLFHELLQIIYRKSCLTDAVPLANRDSMAPVVAAIGSALFFGLHPLRVESVVWASARKDVLCLFFICSALWFYLRFARRTDSSDGKQPFPTAFYLASLTLTALALMSKPLAISLPLVLLIIDWYPLNRINSSATLFRCLAEKIPFVLLALFDMALTQSAQKIAMNKIPELSVLSRLLVACKALLFYLVKSVWPSGLAPFYGHPGNVAASSLTEYLGYAAIVGAIVVAALYAGRATRVWPALCLFYGITLLPMLGIIQVGRQWAADRYSYLPAVGLSLLWGGGCVWLIRRLRGKGHQTYASACILIAISQLVFNTIVTARLIPVWHDTGTLTTRVIELAPHQAARPYLARAAHRCNNRETQGALDDIEEAMNIALQKKDSELYPQMGSTRAVILYRLGRRQEALDSAEWAIKSGAQQLPEQFLRFRDDLSRELSPQQR